MGKHRHRSRFSIGRMLRRSMNPKISDFTGGLNPKNVVAVIPLVVGVIANNLATGAITNNLPFNILKKGIGNYAVGLLDAGIIGALGSWIVKDKTFGRSLRVGGMVEVLGRAIHDMWDQGSVWDALKPNLSGLGVPGYWAQSQFPGIASSFMGTDPWAQSGFQGMNDFVNPMQITDAFSAQGSIMNYALPAGNAVAAPMPGMMPQQGMPQANTYMPGMPQHHGHKNANEAYQDAAVSDEIARAGM